MASVPDSMWMLFAQEMIHRIVKGQYPAGSLLPTEAQLGDEFGVSRTVVREGTKVLGDRGLLVSRRGRGTEVLDPRHWRSFDADVLAARLEFGDRDVVLREVLVLRRSIEPELAASAARLSDDVDLARLGATVAELDAAQLDFERYMKADASFHDIIAELGRNSLLHDIIKILEHPVQIQRALTGRIPGGGTNIAHQQHLVIFGCILNHDAERARHAMLEHIKWAEERLDRVLKDRNGTLDMSSGTAPDTSGQRLAVLPTEVGDGDTASGSVT